MNASVVGEDQSFLQRPRKKTKANQIDSCSSFLIVTLAALGFALGVCGIIMGYNAGNNNLQGCQDEITSMWAQLNKTTNQVNNLANNLTKDVSNLKNSTSTINETLANLSGNFTDAKDLLDSLSSNFSVANSTLKNLTVNYTNITANISSLQSSLTLTNTTLSGIQTNVSSLQTQATGLSSQIGALSNPITLNNFTYTTTVSTSSTVSYTTIAESSLYAGNAGYLVCRSYQNLSQFSPALTSANIYLSYNVNGTNYDEQNLGAGAEGVIGSYVSVIGINAVGTVTVKLQMSIVQSGTPASETIIAPSVACSFL